MYKLMKTLKVIHLIKIDHWVHEGAEQGPTIMGRMTRWLKNSDGVNVLLADRSELGKFNYIKTCINKF